ncbi:MAG: ROK family protein [Pseudomonadota bacterium]|nr:ROK family protein [Pseudomonadota bacterium]
MIRIGIDLGGTKTEGVAMNAAGEVLARERVSTPPDYDGALDMIAALIARLEAGHGPARIGIGHPGSSSPADGRMRNANSRWLNGRPLGEDLERRLGRPVRLANDADCFALSEARDGAGAGHAIVFGVILGTGVGGGIVIDGRLLDGAQRIAGEWGHNPLPWPHENEIPGPACWCGLNGCIETWLSGPGLAQDHARHTGEMLEACEIARSDDPACRDSMARYADRLARALASVINLIDPDVIVLGGGVSNTAGLPDAIQAKLAGHVFSDILKTRVVRHRHGDSSGVRGAAWLWPGETP